MKNFLQTKNSKGVVWLKVFVVFLLTIMVGCKYDFVVPIPEPVPDVVVTLAYASSYSVAYNGTTEVFWESKNVDSITFNGVRVLALIGSKKVDSLKSDTVFKVKFYAKSLTLPIKTESMTIKVAEPIIVLPTRTDTITRRYWMLTKDSKYLSDSDGFWHSTNWTDDELAKKLYFSTNGTCHIIKKSGEPGGSAYWNWVGQDSIKMGGVTYRYQLTDSTFIRSERECTIIDVYKGFIIPNTK